MDFDSCPLFLYLPVGVVVSAYECEAEVVGSFPTQDKYLSDKYNICSVSRS